jgi:alkanesulfonate monooxygenase SsuD/methylene tetrahydromethanopterin reductase-like flavin-dependent oxidoreductase (luciferase family)
MMHFGIEVVPFGEYSDPRPVVALARAAEDAGWEAIWLWDHVVFPYGAGDPWITLAAVATATTDLKLVTGVAPLPRYRPHLLARMLTALDRLSQGRVIFGTGAGVDFDFTPFGEAVAARTRAAMLDEGLELLAKLLSGAETTHHGAHYTAEAVQLAPSPVQQPRIPVWIGGGSLAALRRAAQWDGWIIGAIDEQQTITLTPEQLAAQVATIRRYRSADTPFDVAVDGVSAAGDDGALAREYAEAGATWWFEGIFGSRGSHAEMLQRIHAGPPR